MTGVSASLDQRMSRLDPRGPCGLMGRSPAWLHAPRAKRIPDGDRSKLNRSFLQNAIVGSKYNLGRLHPSDWRLRPEQTTTPLGATGRTGGVDDVGGVVGTERPGALGVRGVRLRALSQCADRVGLIKQKLSNTLRQPLGDPGAGQDTGRLGVPEHIAQPLHRVLRIQGQIRRPGFKDTQ